MLRMIKLLNNNNRVFNKQIIEVLKDDFQLLGLDSKTFQFLKENVLSGKNIQIVDKNNPNSPKENYDILNVSNYVGNIILNYNSATKFWEIDLFIFHKYRKNRYAKKALEELINLHPNRKWEANILERNKNLKILQDYLFELGFEKTDNGLFDKNNEDIIYNYRKANNKIISVIGTAFLYPISDLLDNLLKRSNGEINELQASEIENGYSASVILLLIAFFESNFMREYYFSNIEKKNKNVDTYIKTKYPDFPYLTEIRECYVLRDSIMHNHIWVMEHTYVKYKISTSKKSDFSGNTNYNNYVDLKNRVTKKLKLNVNPILINRKDVKIVLKTIWESLEYVSKQNKSEIILSYTPVVFDRRIQNFKDVYEIFIKRV